MMEDTSKKEFVKDCLREFLYKHSVKSPFLFNVPGDCSFIVNKNNIEALTDFLFSEMEHQESFFEYNYEGLLDNENKILKVPYNNSNYIHIILKSLKNYLHDDTLYRSSTESFDLQRLIECLEKQYSEILRIENLEQEQKRKEEQEKRDYSEYLRLKKKYES